jgi:hypothetical protein
VVNKRTRSVLWTAFTKGVCHDFRLFKESRTHIHPEIPVLTDRGYQGIQIMHPQKAKKHQSLTREEKQKNRELARERGGIEDVIGVLKRFKIIADRYRNRRKRFGLRFNLLLPVFINGSSLYQGYERDLILTDIKESYQLSE